MQNSLRQAKRNQRRLMLEGLELRSLMAMLPFGAMPDDTGEYMLGDITVSVVLMESNTSILPRDTSTENWNSSSIAAVKAKVEAGVNWWKETLVNEFPDVNPDVLSFQFDYTYADTPVQTGFEAITRKSDDNTQWVYSFLSQTGISLTGAISTDIRAFNNAQRIKHNSSWAFTIFAVNDANDPDHAFGADGRFSYGFAFAGGRYVVIPASRPTSSYTHEVGHMFWALDEYANGGNYADSRGYYNTQNVNSPTGAPSGFRQYPSIMSNDIPLNSNPAITPAWPVGSTSMSYAYNNHISSDSTLAMIGWKDSDSDGIFDVLDVPFSLEGSGWFDEADGTYKFLGNSSVRTFGNKNPEGLGNDITINVIREAQYSVNGSAWQTAGTYNAYQTDLALAFSIPTDALQVRIRTIDTVTGAASPEFVTDRPMNPSVLGSSGVTGLVWNDTDYDGIFDVDEIPVIDTPIQLVDAQGHNLVLHKTIIPDSYAERAALETVHPDVTLSANVYASGSPLLTGEVVAMTSLSSPTADRVFGAPSDVDTNLVFDTWNLDARALRAEFSQPVTTVSLRAWGTNAGSVGRLEAYNSAGNLVGRYTTQFLTSTESEVMTVNRSEGDIAYVLAGGDFNRLVVLEDLEWGPQARTTTDSRGAYWLPNLPEGTYQVKTALSQFQITSTPVGGPAEVNVVANAAQTVGFGIIQLPNPWHNSAVGRSADVNNDGGVDIDDILAAIFYFNQYAGQELPNSGPSGAAFVDIDNDGSMTITDILMVVGKYNETQGNGEPSSSSTTTSGGSSGSSGVNGLGGDSGPNGETPAEYFVDVPSDHLEHVHTDDEHEHDELETVAAGEGESAAAFLLGLLNESQSAGGSSPSSTTTASQGSPSNHATVAQDSAILALLDEPLI